MSWCSDAPEDEAISLFAGLLANPDVPLTHPDIFFSEFFSFFFLKKTWKNMI